MKSIIRKGMFETNSSSMHSLIIKKDSAVTEDLTKLGDTVIIDPSNCDICRGDDKIITGAIEKAEALISMAICGSKVMNEDIYCDHLDVKRHNNDLHEEIKPYTDAVKKAFEELKIFKKVEIKLPTLYLYNPIYSPENERIKMDGAWFSNSYEFDDFLKAILANPSLLHMFLFNKESLIISAWDEDDEGYELTDQVRDEVAKEGLNKYSLFAGATWWPKEIENEN